MTATEIEQGWRVVVSLVAGLVALGFAIKAAVAKDEAALVTLRRNGFDGNDLELRMAPALLSLIAAFLSASLGVWVLDVPKGSAPDDSKGKTSDEPGESTPPAKTKSAAPPPKDDDSGGQTPAPK